MVAFTELNDAGLHYYAFPMARLMHDPGRTSIAESAAAPDTVVENHTDTDESLTPALVDIKHIGESRAVDLRRAGYESVGDVAGADQSGLANVDGIGEARAETMTASATDLLDVQSDDSAADTQDETETDAPESREATEADTDFSAAIVALSRYLDGDGMDATIAPDGESVRVRQADESYRVSLTGGVEGDGPHRSQLEEAVEKVRAATQAPND